MIRFDCAQGSAEWFALRLGIPTASMFDKIITNKTMKLSASSDAYAHQLIAEQALGVAQDGATSGFMQRGSFEEKHAVDFYELTRDVDTQKVGFVMRDDRRVGCSPDRLVGTNGLLEIKVPSAPVHISYLLDDEGIGYRAQVQGQLWICEREWCDTVSFNDRLPSALVRQERDDKFIAALEVAVENFLNVMDEMKAKLQRHGMFKDFEAPMLRVVA